ncbi:hypothetical protein BGZ65_001846 [Modicella reniformis]|uniref:Uncharacterized protein n=1 Tax=Modicella reniformis TaxID=1440133 RepID=A0A9P6LSB5_9FUNG|nr:hypothetical protein BGZ65_001846 [Modicella reniformis]
MLATLVALMLIRDIKDDSQTRKGPPSVRSFLLRTIMEHSKAIPPSEMRHFILAYYFSLFRDLQM